MKKIAILLTLYFSFLQTGFSCDCIGSSKTFCDEASSITENQIVVRVQIASREGLGGKARILNLYKGIENEKIIQIWGGSGADCTEMLGSVGQVFIMILRRIEQINQFNPEFEVGDYKAGFICSNNRLSVDKGKIIGMITNPSKSDTITDSDPTNLFFCPKFSSDVQELEKINIFPNPTSKNLTVSGLKSVVTLDIYDVLGRHLFEKLITVSDNTVVFNDLTSGVYIIRFRKNNAIKGLKFVKI
jgi:Secretion system C-terminal sorting domain